MVAVVISFMLPIFLIPGWPFPFGLLETRWAEIAEKNSCDVRHYFLSYRTALRP
jgi:hypothetical protein